VPSTVYCSERSLVVQACTECGGLLSYDSALKQYYCKSCGLTFTPQQLLNARIAASEGRETADERKRRKHRDYENWWLSKK
jgi:hypothetical protein